MGTPDTTATISLVIFAVLILLGGIMGYVKAKSKASLISGSVSALLFAACAWFTQNDPLIAFDAAFMLCAILEGVFVVRLLKTKKFMPSGMMLVLCLVEQIILWPSLRH